MSEFQAVILAGGSGMRLYPLTMETPKALLPANGRPLLWYQLNLLETSGFSHALVVSATEMLPQIQDYLSREYDGKVHVDLCEVEDNMETADALREVADKIKKDFIVVAGDLITDVVVQNVADCHRLNDATVTMLLRPERPLDKAKGEKPRRDKDMTDCIGLVPKENRVVFLSQAVHLEEDIAISKSLTKRCPHFTLHTDLYDPHLYIFSHWVLDYLQEKKDIASIKADLVPRLVRRQFRGRAALSDAVREKAVNKQQLAASLSLTTAQHDDDDVVRCFAYLLPANGYAERADTTTAYNAMKDEVKSRLRLASRSSSISA
ncbi:hypothetical protein ATCC90586_007050 [Pythium insidiosum]|nr:hypothetical protein ATCC90586_007050 [Pythium insidiosum]